LKDVLHSAKGVEIVFDMFEDVEADAGVEAEVLEIEKCGRGDIAGKSVEIFATREPFDTRGFDVDGDDECTVQQEAGEVANAASDFEDASPKFGGDEAMLPGEIIFRPRHARLIFERVGGADAL